MKMVAGIGSMLIQNRSSTSGQELLCVLVRKDIMAPNWRGVYIGYRKNALPLTTMDCNSKKATKAT